VITVSNFIMNENEGLWRNPRSLLYSLGNFVSIEHKMLRKDRTKAFNKIDCVVNGSMIQYVKGE